MPNLLVDNIITRATQIGMNWDTAKWRMYCIKEAPWGDMQRLTNFLSMTNPITSTGGALTTYKTIAANDLNKGLSTIYEKVILTKTKYTGSRVYNAGSNYVYGDLVHASVVPGRPVNTFIHKCIYAGSHNSHPLWTAQPGGYSATASNAGPAFQNTGIKVGEWPHMGGFYLYPPATGYDYQHPSNVSFTISGFNTVDRFPGPLRAANASGDYGIVYPMRTWMDQWAPESAILSMSAPLTSTVIRPNGVLDCNDTEISTGSTNSANVFLLLVRVAHNPGDPDLPYDEQEPIAFWDYARNIGSLYSSDNFTGTAMLGMSNMLQLATPIGQTEAGSAVEE
jgi:hypothetical protein